MKHLLSILFLIYFVVSVDGQTIRLDTTYYSIFEAQINPLDVKKLDLLNNGNLPRNITIFKNIQEIYLRGDDEDFDLDTLYPEFYDLTTLKKIYIGATRINSISPDIRKLTNLEKLETGWYNLPSEIGELKNLKEIRCQNLPKTLTVNNLQNLSEISSTNLPSWVKDLKNLKTLYLNVNSKEFDEKRIDEKVLDYIPNTIEFLEIKSWGMTLENEIPVSFKNLTQLKHLKIHSLGPNFRIESIFEILAYLPNLESLELSFNNPFCCQFKFDSTIIKTNWFPALKELIVLYPPDGFISMFQKTNIKVLNSEIKGNEILSKSIETISLTYSHELDSNINYKTLFSNIKNLHYTIGNPFYFYKDAETNNFKELHFLKNFDSLETLVLNMETDSAMIEPVFSFLSTLSSLQHLYVNFDLWKVCKNPVKVPQFKNLKTLFIEDWILLKFDDSISFESNFPNIKQVGLYKWFDLYVDHHCTNIQFILKSNEIATMFNFSLYDWNNRYYTHYYLWEHNYSSPYFDDFRLHFTFDTLKLNKSTLYQIQYKSYYKWFYQHYFNHFEENPYDSIMNNYKDENHFTLAPLKYLKEEYEYGAYILNTLWYKNGLLKKQTLHFEDYSTDSIDNNEKIICDWYRNGKLKSVSHFVNKTLYYQLVFDKNGLLIMYLNEAYRYKALRLYNLYYE